MFRDAAVIVFAVIAGTVLTVVTVKGGRQTPVPSVFLPLTRLPFVLVSLISTLFQRFSGKRVKMQIWGPHSVSGLSRLVVGPGNRRS